MASDLNLWKLFPKVISQCTSLAVGGAITYQTLPCGFSQSLCSAVSVIRPLSCLSDTHRQVVEKGENKRETEGRKEESLMSEWVGDITAQRWKEQADRSTTDRSTGGRVERLSAGVWMSAESKAGGRRRREEGGETWVGSSSRPREWF